VRDPRLSDDHPAWLRYVRTGAEVTLAVAGGVLGVLDALARHQSGETDDELVQLPAPRNNEEVSS